MKQFFLIILLIPVNHFCYAQEKTQDLLPKRLFKIGILNTSCEFKINPKVTITPVFGFGVAFQTGYSYTGKFSELGFFPRFGTSAKYYFKIKNTNKKGKINSLFSGQYISLNSDISGTLIGKFKWIYIKPEYGFSLSLGKQIQKSSGWNFGYSLSYLLFTKTVATPEFKSEILPNKFHIGLDIGYSFL